MGSDQVPAMRAFFSLGSNLRTALGDPSATVLAGLEVLARTADLELVGRSSVYRTEPIGGGAQPDFANLVAAMTTRLGPRELVETCLAVEHGFGRRRERPNGPRTLDIDLLLLGSEVSPSARARVPHPRLHRRRFVLEPLAELAPEVVHPELGRTVRELLAGLDDRSRVELWHRAADRAPVG